MSETEEVSSGDLESLNLVEQHNMYVEDKKEMSTSLEGLGMNGDQTPLLEDVKPSKEVDEKIEDGGGQESKAEIKLSAGSSHLTIKQIGCDPKEGFEIQDETKEVKPSCDIKLETKNESQENTIENLSHIKDEVKPCTNEDKTSSNSVDGKGNAKVIMLSPLGINSNSAKKPRLEASQSTTAVISTQIGTINLDFIKLSKALATALTSETKKRVFCDNSNCNMKTDTVVDAPIHARLYFGISKTASCKICPICLKKAEVFHQKTKNAIRNKKNLFDIHVEVQTADSVVDLDLDSPVSSPDGAQPYKEVKEDNGDMYSISENVLTDIVNNMMESMNLKEQVQMCKQKLEDEVESLTNDLDTLGVNMDLAKDSIHELTQQYNEMLAVRPQIFETGVVDISSSGSIAIKTGTDLDKIEGLSRKEVIALNKYISNMKLLETKGAAAPEVPRNSHGQGILRTIPQNGKVIFSKPKEGQEVYAMHKHALYYWLPARILKISSSISANRPTIYTVQFQEKVKSRTKITEDNEAYVKEVTGKQLAFKKPYMTNLLPVGCRIIAKFKDLLNTDAQVDGKLYAGIIAEAPKILNEYRYLVFFDDGYAQYVQPQEVFPVVETSPEVWLDVHRNSQEFIRGYVTKYPDRHMIRAVVGTFFNVELNGIWLLAKAVAVDGSLIKVHYTRQLDGVEYEWIYRGSTRLGPLYTRLKALESKPIPTFARRHTYSPRSGHVGIEVNRDYVEDEELVGTSKVAKKPTCHDGRVGIVKPVLKAKNGVLVSTVLESQGSMIKISIPRSCPTPRSFVPHACSRDCGYQYVEDDYRKVSPLAIPFYLGWAREIYGPNRDQVLYHTPCGKRCKTYEEIHGFIVRAELCIPIDFYSLESNIDCLNEFEPSRRIETLKDISYGKEWTPVPCVNSLDRDLPTYMEYITARIPGKDVNVNLDDGFLVCCDCEDDCEDPSKCACIQLTMSGVSFKIAEKEGTPLQTFVNRRLKNHVFSGIYECNRRCKCKSTCFNRVVQHKVKWPVQIFKTMAKGWGVRALHDMPQGSFITVYTGQLLTDATANEDGKEYGDEFLAELDFIECNEQIKEEYESDVTDIETEEPGARSTARLAAKANSAKTEEIRKAVVHKAVKSTAGIKRSTGVVDSSSDKRNDSTVVNPVARKSGSKNGSYRAGGKGQTSTDSSKRGESSITLRRRKSKNDSDSDDDDGTNLKAYSSFSASTMPVSAIDTPRLPLREYYGKDEAVYIMDAKSMGNFGRYLNHSCEPNVFVQNLFVDTHDVRFPWVAFFTKKDVQAGTELTWDYNYDIGSVPGKTLICYCLQPNCRNRLL